MRVAVIFTGALRTIKKTIHYFKKNILLNSDVAVFACIQNDTSQSNSEWEIWLKEHMGSSLKNIEWFTMTHELIYHREKILSNIILAENWKNYLRNSGSIIEYIQLQYANFAITKYEQTNNIKFDYIIRSRTDTIFAKPIDFHWLNFSDEEISLRILKIREVLEQNSIDVSDKNILTYFMTTIISDDFISNIHNINASYITHKFGNNIELSRLKEFIQSGAYILTMRVNNLYIVRRDLFYLIPSLGSIYGHLRFPFEDSYWFNAENQFKAVCYHSNLAIFDYRTIFEDKSLYEYDENRYFNLEYNLVNPNMLYCVVRH